MKIGCSKGVEPPCCIQWFGCHLRLTGSRKPASGTLQIQFYYVRNCWWSSVMFLFLMINYQRRGSDSEPWNPDPELYPCKINVSEALAKPKFHHLKCQCSASFGHLFYWKICRPFQSNNKSSDRSMEVWLPATSENHDIPTEQRTDLGVHRVVTLPIILTEYILFSVWGEATVPSFCYSGLTCIYGKLHFFCYMMSHNPFSWFVLFEGIHFLIS